MKLLSSSLRFRLFVLIMLPLLIVACAAIYWRFEEARKTAADIFDRQLIMICLAVSRDVSYSGGDSLSPTTMNLFEDAAGSPIFYHVYGPDGSFVTGYSSPPVSKIETDMRQNVPQVFDALHLGRAVRAVRLIESVEISGISGASVVTVWQELEPRQNFARDLALKAAMVMALLILTVAGVVIFGIRLGLRPLGQLEEAIRKRNPSDIRPIERQVPFEAKGIVSRLNVLFSQLTQAQEVSDRIISNAAHQLRNPVAAIHSMAQATLAAKSLPDSKDRALQLVDETRRAVRMTNQMLSLEQLRGRNPKFSSNDINKVIKDLTSRLAPKALKRDIDFNVNLLHETIHTLFDPILISEAITNLIENALQHGGKQLSKITINVLIEGKFIKIEVENDGQKLLGAEIKACFERFSQIGENPGAGLGLALVNEIAEIHNGGINVVVSPQMKFTFYMAIS